MFVSVRNKGWEASRRLLTPVGAHQGPVVLSTG